MKKRASKSSVTPKVQESRPEYDFSGGVRGKHAARYAKGTNIVVLDPDVAKAFPDSAAVNEALRDLMLIVSRHRRPARRKKGSAAQGQESAGQR